MWSNLYAPRLSKHVPGNEYAAKKIRTWIENYKNLFQMNEQRPDEFKNKSITAFKKRRDFRCVALSGITGCGKDIVLNNLLNEFHVDYIIINASTINRWVLTQIESTYFYVEEALDLQSKPSKPSKPSQQSQHQSKEINQTQFPKIVGVVETKNRKPQLTTKRKADELEDTLTDEKEETENKGKEGKEGKKKQDNEKANKKAKIGEVRKEEKWLTPTETYKINGHKRRIATILTPVKNVTPVKIKTLYPVVVIKYTETMDSELLNTLSNLTDICKNLIICYNRQDLDITQKKVLKNITASAEYVYFCPRADICLLKDVLAHLTSFVGFSVNDEVTKVAALVCKNADNLDIRKFVLWIQKQAALAGINSAGFTTNKHLLANNHPECDTTNIENKKRKINSNNSSIKKHERKNNNKEKEKKKEEEKDKEKDKGNLKDFDADDTQMDPKAEVGMGIDVGVGVEVGIGVDVDKDIIEALIDASYFQDEDSSTNTNTNTKQSYNEINKKNIKNIKRPVGILRIGADNLGNTAVHSNLANHALEQGMACGLPQYDHTADCMPQLLRSFLKNISANLSTQNTTLLSRHHNNSTKQTNNMKQMCQDMCNSSLIPALSDNLYFALSNRDAQRDIKKKLQILSYDDCNGCNIQFTLGCAFETCTYNTLHAQFFLNKNACAVDTYFAQKRVSSQNIPPFMKYMLTQLSVVGVWCASNASYFDLLFDNKNKNKKKNKSKSKSKSKKKNSNNENRNQSIENKPKKMGIEIEIERNFKINPKEHPYAHLYSQRDLLVSDYVWFSSTKKMIQKCYKAVSVLIGEINASAKSFFSPVSLTLMNDTGIMDNNNNENKAEQQTMLDEAKAQRTDKSGEVSVAKCDLKKENKPSNKTIASEQINPCIMNNEANLYPQIEGIVLPDLNSPIKIGYIQNYKNRILCAYAKRQFIKNREIKKLAASHHARQKKSAL